MENEKQKTILLASGIIIAGLIIGGAVLYSASQSNNRIKKSGQESNNSQNNQSQTSAAAYEKLVIPEEGVELPIVWGDLGSRMAQAGVIDSAKMESLYIQRGGIDEEMKQILSGKNNGKIKMTMQNSGFLLNMFWALGLGNKSDVLDKGPMKTSGTETGNFASTGGWTLAKGDVMNHYSKYNFINLSADQQNLVKRVSQGIYRPCCDNPTYFPDCNHGMAMLGLLELMASQGVSEEEMYRVALKVNSYWFPDTYLTIAKYLQEKKNLSFDKADPKEILGENYSSGSGFQSVLQQITPVERSGGGGCGV